MRKIIIFAVIINLALSTYSQEREATIFFNDSTSIKGFGEIKKQKIYFRDNSTNVKSVWSYDLTKGVIFSENGFSEKHEYVKTDKSSKPILLEVVQEGNITLYKDPKELMVTTTRAIVSNGQLQIVSTKDPIPKDVSETFYAKRKNEEFATDLTSSFKSSALKYFSDCPIIMEKIKTREFKANTIPLMVFYYNDLCGKDNKD